MKEFILIILHNIETFALTMFGIGITIFTVIYSFIVSKRSYYKAICHEEKKQLIPSTCSL